MDEWIQSIFSGSGPTRSLNSHRGVCQRPAESSQIHCHIALQADQLSASRISNGSSRRKAVASFSAVLKLSTPKLFGSRYRQCAFRSVREMEEIANGDSGYATIKKVSVGHSGCDSDERLARRSLRLRARHPILLGPQSSSKSLMRSLPSKGDRFPLST